MDEPVRLTRYSHGGGCGCKLGPADLERIVARLPRREDDKLLVGLETGDDAAVYWVAPGVAVVQTLDFFMPVVDDPVDFGRIAAANALSDVYAMRGRPTLALAIVGMPTAHVTPEVMALVLEGGSLACDDAGIAIVGGHSIDDTELKFGLSVTGVVDPERIWRNTGAAPGDWLVLTKPLGVGTLASRVKKGIITPDEYATLVRTTTFLNRAPAEAGQAVGVSACTDVTGFGLLGHAWKMASGGGLGLELWVDALPELPGARASIAEGVVPGGTHRNLAHYGARTTWDEDVTDVDRLLIADPQTSGGLLFAVSDKRLGALREALVARGALAAAVVGRFGEPGEHPLRVRRQAR
ncbi:MAG: selenide, water dikinase SelD [Pseudomonadota bacterium]|nr:selenide, water dikinase SelD [Pseudomonadota bacterium]